MSKIPTGLRDNIRRTLEKIKSGAYVEKLEFHRMQHYLEDILEWDSRQVDVNIVNYPNGSIVQKASTYVSDSGSSYSGHNAIHEIEKVMWAYHV